MRTMFVLLASIMLVNAGELHDAARVCDAERLQQIILRNPSLNEMNENGLTPLHVAVDARKRQCIGLLLKAGADRNARDRQGRTPIDAAEAIADPRDRSVLVHMVRNFYLEGTGGAASPKPSWLEYWVTRRQPDVTTMMLKLGADPNTVGTGGTTPLADAALRGDLDAVRALLAHGAKPNVTSLAGVQPIHDAALGDNAEIIRELVKAGADVNARTRDENQTPLHLAAAMGKMKSLEALLALGADLTSKDSNGRTPAEAAERAGLTEVVKFLRRH